MYVAPDGSYSATYPSVLRRAGAGAIDWILCWVVWLVASIVNGAFGVMHAGIPVINEIGAFIPIFGVPAALAWYLAYKRGR